MSKFVRIFPLVFGGSPNLSLIKGMTRSTGGNFRLIDDETPLDSVVVDILDRVRREKIEILAVRWNSRVPVESVVRIENDLLIVYGLTNGESFKFDGRISIEIQSERVSFGVDFQTSKVLLEKSQIVTKLAAKALVDRFQRKANDFSAKYQICPYRQIRSRNNDDFLRLIIDRQSADGLWRLETIENILETILGQSLRVFQSRSATVTSNVLISVITIVVLETKFSREKSLWEKCAEKARRCLIFLLDNNWSVFVRLFNEVRQVIVT